MGNLLNEGPTTLRTHSDFQRVFKQGKRFFRNGLGFYFRKAEEQNFRYGMSVPKRHGIAVERNLLRRRIREIIRLSNKLPESTDIIICVAKPCRELSFDVLQKTLDWAFDKTRRTYLAASDEK